MDNGHLSDENKLVAFYAYSTGAMDHSPTGEIKGLSEMFAVWAIDQHFGGSPESIKELWTRFLRIPDIIDYVQRVVLYG